MKIQPSKHYKKPRYATALASLLAAVGLTGCGPQLEGDVPMPEDTEPSQTDPKPEDVTAEETEEETPVMLDGDVVIDPADDVCTDTELRLSGDIALPEDVEIAGEMAVEEDKTTLPD